MKLDDSQMLIDNQDDRVTMAMHSLRSDHYELLVAYLRGIPSVPCYPLGVDMSSPAMCPPIEEIRASIEITPTIHIRQVMHEL